MSSTMLVFSGLLIAMLGVSLLLVMHSMRKYSTRRAESERRAAEAFAEMQRLTKELRERGAEPVDGTLTPGERLKQMYPGVRGRPTPVGEKG